MNDIDYQRIRSDRAERQVRLLELIRQLQRQGSCPALAQIDAVATLLEQTLRAAEQSP